MIYQGSTPKFLVRIKDENGNQIDPSDSQIIVEAKIYLYNAINGTIIGKFYLNTDPEPNTGWIHMTIEEITETDKRIQLILTSAMTKAAQGNSNMIQINLHFVDPDCPGSVRIDIKKGKFPEITKAVE